MPARGSDKCRQCSKLSISQELEKYGSSGDGCWERTPCNKRRTYYRGAIALIRSCRLKYVGDKESAQKLDAISLPTIPAVVIHFYRQRKHEPLYALEIELWVGQQKRRC